MPRTLGWIRQFHQPDSPEGPTLLVFPHAGAGASAYRSFSKVLSKHFRVLVFQYPGRQDRAGEPPLRTGPIVAFGHSMGGWVAFEFVRIAESRGIDVRELNVSAAVAPGNAVTKPPHPTDDESILQHLTALEGTNSAVFGNSDLIRLALPVIKADYRACDAYSCPDDVKIAARIHALGGDQDPIVTLGDLYGWGKHTDSAEVTMFDGGHFFINDHVDAVAELLAACAQREQTQ